MSIELQGLKRVRRMLDRKKVDKAVVPAINKTAKSTLTKASDVIRKEEGWKLKKRDLDKRLAFKKARRNDPVAVLSPRRKSAATGRFTGKDSFSLPFFGAKDVRRGRHGVITTSRSKHGGLVAARRRSGGKGGVTVQVQKGGKKAHWPNAFIAQMPSGHIGAYRRVNEVDSKGRQKIKEVKVVSVATMFGGIRPRLVRHAQRRWRVEFPRALRRQYPRSA